MATIIVLPIRTEPQQARRRYPARHCQIMLFNGIRYERLPSEPPKQRDEHPARGGGQAKRRKLKTA